MTSWVPEACTLPSEEQPLRVAEFDALFTTAVRPAERTAATALLLHLPADGATGSAAADLIARETGCCSFFSFELRPGGDGTDLLVEVPESQTAVLDVLQERAEAARAGRAR